MSYEVTVIGEIYLDHVFSGFADWPKPGEEIFTEEYVWELGGGAVTTACALAKLGRSVQLIGVVGRDQFATVQKRLAEFNVSSEHLIQSDVRSGITVSISTAQDRTFFTYRGANAELESQLIADRGILQNAADARHVHMAFPLGLQGTEHMLSVLRAHDAALSLDVGHQVNWLRNPGSLNILRAVDYFFPNEKEANILCEQNEDYAQFSRRVGLRNSVVKLGPAGAAMFTAETEYRVLSPDVKVLDTTGAGDAFDAGFIEGLLSHLSPMECLAYGCACGALSTRVAGALQGLPTRKQVEEISEGINAA